MESLSAPLALVVLVGTEAKGATRWLTLPGIGRFQPAELMKLAVPAMVAWFFSERNLPPNKLDVLAALGLIFLPVVMIAVQPDLGTSILIAAAGLVVLFMATSADSMSYAAAMVVSGQSQPPAVLRLFWALMIGSLTLVLLRIGSGLGDSTSIDALQAFIVITAVPVTPLVLATLWSAPRLAWKEAQREGLN